jgi:hypothetical protein
MARRGAWNRFAAALRRRRKVAGRSLVVAPRSRTAMGQPAARHNAQAGATVLMLLAMVVLIVARLNLANMLLAPERRASRDRPAAGAWRQSRADRPATAHRGSLLSLLGGTVRAAHGVAGGAPGDGDTSTAWPDPTPSSR